ncbi:MAG: hypothetical protein AB1798_17610, partial [Spirochaetota bacterium]
MNKRARMLLIILAPVVVIFVTAALIPFFSTDTTLSFSVVDAVSKEWIWGVKMSVQNRVIEGHFRKDFVFAHLKPGDFEFQVSAPYYTEKTMPVKLKRGGNRLKDPIELQGYEIPDLDRFIVFENLTGSEVLLELRPVGKDTKAITNHPCLDLKIAARIYEEMKDGVWAQTEIKSGASRGKVIYSGLVDWEWDSEPETLFRYAGKIPLADIQKTSAPYLVIDYLFLVPDPR